MTGNFRLVERRVLNTPARPCQEAESYSFTRCMLEFVAARVGCHLDLAGTHRLAQYPPCRSVEQIEKYSDLLEKMKDYSWVRLTRETGCYGKCHYKEYKFIKGRVMLKKLLINICLFRSEGELSPGMLTIPRLSS